MTDYATLSAVALSGFFVALSLVLLARYRKASREMSASSELAKDVWESLDSRLRKQDERILDVMTRLDVLQGRVLESAQPKSQPITSRAEVRHQAAPPQATSPPPAERVGPEKAVVSGGAPARPPAPQELTRGDDIETKILQRLTASATTSVEIRQLIGKSREHTARLMKGLYDRGLVVRDDSTKPFVYQLTDEGRRRASSA
jgi:hypothetical protein